MVFGHYARAAAAVKEIEIVAVFDPDPSKPRTHDSLEAMLDEPLDAVLVLTPNAAHAATVEACLDRRIPTLCEKPLASSAAAARALFDRADASGTLLYAAMHARHRPEVRWLGEHLDAPVTRFMQSWREDWRDAPSWYFDAAQAGGGVLLDVGINHIDWIGAHVPPLQISDAAAEWDGDVEHDCHVQWTFDGGAGTTRISWRGSPEERRSVVETGDGARYELLHDHNALIRGSRMHGPWRNDEYESVLRDFSRCLLDPSTHRPASPLPTLTLIDRVYQHLAARRTS
jgi:predicted dehydrogenase